MNAGHALIVDDSKTAQHRLKMMLEKFDLGIEMVSSAEEALAHLSYNQPAVIFLDHHMAGMSGMDALKTIKANPSTALLPVIMYTSEKDELFIGQARALGALDILSKSTMQPSSLEKVLESLNIPRRGSAPVVSEEKAVVVAPKPPTSVTVQTSDLQQIRSQVGRLFEIHIAEVRNQIDASTHFVVKRLSGVFENKLQRDKFNEGAFLSKVTAANAAEMQKSAFITRMLVGAVLLAVGFCLYEVAQVQSDLQLVSKNVQASLDNGREENHRVAETLNRLVSEKRSEEPRMNSGALAQVIELMQNTDFQFAYEEAPLNSRQVGGLAKIVSLLAESGYAGYVNVDIHFGNFCVEPGTVANTWRLARSDLPATSCKMLKDLSPKSVSEDYATPAYRSFVQNSTPLQEGRIRIQLAGSGYDPVVDYPNIRSSTTAGEWNSVAMKNNRISIHFPYGSM